MTRLQLIALVTLVAWLAPGRIASAQERLGAIPPDQMTEAQKKAVEEFTKVRRNGPFGFWWGYLRVPEVMMPFLEIQTHVHGVMETEKGALGEKLTHFAMLIAAREWTQNVIWDLHDKNAAKSGLKPETMSALAAGRRPPNMSDDEAIVYDFCIELQHNRSVSDETYARMVKRVRRARRRRGDAHSGRVHDHVDVHERGADAARSGRAGAVEAVPALG